MIEQEEYPHILQKKAIEGRATSKMVRETAS